MTSINNTAINNWPIPSALEEWGYSLNWFDLCWDNSAIISFPDKHDANYNLNIQNNPYIDWSVLLSRLLNQKTATLNIFIKADSEWELNESIDSFKKAMSFEEAPFTMPVVLTTGTEIREIKVSQESITMTQPEAKQLTRQFTVVFQATSTPRRYAKDIVAKTYTAVTWNFNADVNNTGTANTLPEYYFIFKTVTSLTKVEIVVDWYTLTVNNTFATDDILIVNTEVWIDWKWFVKLNDVEVDYDGKLDNELTPWTNIINFGFVWDFECDLSILYKKTYE